MQHGTTMKIITLHVSDGLAGTRRNSSHLVPASKQSTNLYGIYLMLCVQSWTPDDGRKDRPKHVECYSINSKIVHLVGFTVDTHLINLHPYKRHFTFAAFISGLQIQ